MLSINDLIFKACNNYLLENQRQAAFDVNSAINNALSLYVESTYLLDNNTLIWMACNKYLGETQGDINTAIYAVASSYLSDRGKTVPGDINGAVRDALYVYLGMDAYLYLNFLSNTYRTGGKEYNSFTNIPGATSVGGAGFGMVQRNGIWTPVPADAPLIGDGGLGVWEARTNSIQNPTFQNAVAGTPGTNPSFMNFGFAGVNRRIVGTGTENGLPYIEVRFWGTNTGSTQPVSIFLNDSGAPATVGQAWTASLQLRLMAGSWDNVNTALFRIYEQQGLTFLASSPTTSVKGTGGSITPYSQQHTLAQPDVDNTKAVVSLGVTVGATIDLTLRLYAPNLKRGPDINDPPILQESGLPATRTACGIGAPQATDTTAGTVIVEGMWLPNQGSGVRVIAEPGLAGNGSGFSLSADNLSPRAVFYGSTNEAVRFDGAGPAISPGASYKFGLSWSSSGVVASAQGATIARSGTAPQILFNPSHLLSLGSRGVGTSLHSNGLIRRVRWLPDYSDQAALNARTAL